VGAGTTFTVTLPLTAEPALSFPTGDGFGTAVLEEPILDLPLAEIIDWLAGEVGLGRRQLERRVHELTTMTPAQLVRRLRMERASQLLRASSGTISEVAYAVGFTNSSYFAKVFRQFYGERPTEHVKEQA
jgi:AraC-like DNA-binding protein